MSIAWPDAICHCPHPHSSCCLQNAWELSDEQAQDLMHIRQLLITRSQVLRLERNTFLTKIATYDTVVPQFIPVIHEIEALTAAFRRKVDESHEMWYRVARAIYRGVSLWVLHSLLQRCIHCGLAVSTYMHGLGLVH